MAKNINVILTLQDRFSNKMSAASYQTLMFEKRLTVAKAASEKMAGAMNTMEKYVKRTAVALGAATVAEVKSSLDAFSEYESKMNEVAGIKGISTVSEDMQKLNQAAKDSAQAVKGTDYTQAAEALKYLALAGWNTKDSITALVPTLQAIKINGVDVKETADAITDSMTALGLSAEQAQEFVDLSTVVQGATNTNILQLNNALIKAGAGFQGLYARAGTAAEKMEVVKDTMGMIGVLSSGGFKDTKAGTILNSIFTRMVKETGETQKGLEQIGLSLYDNNGKLKSSLDIFTEMNKRVSKLNDQQRNTALANIGGRYRAQLEQLLTAMNTVDKDTGKTAIERINDAMKLSDGAAQRYIDAVNAGYSGSMAMLKAQWKDFQIDTGEIFAPYATEVLSYISDKLPEIGEWVQTRIPDALERGKNLLEELKPTLAWIADHFKEIATSAAGIYAGMGAFRLGTGAVSAYSDMKKMLEGGRKIAEARNAAFGDNLKGLQVPQLVTTVTKTGRVSRRVGKKLVDIDTTPVFQDQTRSDLFRGARWSGITEPEEFPEFGGRKYTGTQLAVVPQKPLIQLPKSVSGIDDVLETSAISNALDKVDDAAYSPKRTFRQRVSGALSTTGRGLRKAGSIAGNTVADIALSSIPVAAAPIGAGVSGGVGGAVGGGLTGIASVIAPVAAVAAAVGGVVATLISAYKHSEKFRDALKSLKDAVMPGLETIKDAFSELGPLWENLKGAFAEFGGLVGDILAPLVTLLGPFVSAFAQIVGMGLKAVFSGIATSLGLVSDMLGKINDVLAPVFNMLAKIAEKIREIITLVQQESDQKSPTANYQGAANNNAQGEAEGKSTTTSTIGSAMKTDKRTGIYTVAGAMGGSVYVQEQGQMIRDSDTIQEVRKQASTEHNALGSSYWHGGTTVIHDVRGGEVVDLPRGSRVIPADKSQQFVDNISNNNGMTVNVNIAAMYGEDTEYVNRVANTIAARLAMVM